MAESRYLVFEAVKKPASFELLLESYLNTVCRSQKEPAEEAVQVFDLVPFNEPWLCMPYRHSSIMLETVWSEWSQAILGEEFDGP